jgi:hypothetical protein
MARRTQIFLNAKFDANLIKPIFIYLKNFENQRSAQHPFSIFFPINKAFYKVVEDLQGILRCIFGRERALNLRI